ncbi:MAG: hypothetical protein ABDH23_02310 [Endomicrobiia bacterium]
MIRILSSQFYPTTNNLMEVQLLIDDIDEDYTLISDYLILTPNNDGINDKIVFSENIPYEIFTKDGQKIFSDISNNWDGKDYYNLIVQNGLYLLKTDTKIYFVLVAR